MNHKTLTGRDVIAIESGRKLGQVERLLFDPKTMRVAAIVVRPAGSGTVEAPGPLQAIQADDIHTIGEDVITVPNDQVIQPFAEGVSASHLVAFERIENEEVVTESGTKVGVVGNVEFNDQTLRLESIEVAHGFWNRNRSIPVSEILSVGEDVIMLRDAVLDRGEDEDQQITAESAESV